MKRWAWLGIGTVVGAVVTVACSLNPQPLPPSPSDEATAGNDAGLHNPQPGGDMRSDAASDSHPPPVSSDAGGALDAASDGNFSNGDAGGDGAVDGAVDGGDAGDGGDGSSDAGDSGG